MLSVQYVCNSIGSYVLAGYFTVCTICICSAAVSETCYINMTFLNPVKISKMKKRFTLIFFPHSFICLSALFVKIYAPMLQWCERQTKDSNVSSSIPDMPSDAIRQTPVISKRNLPYPIGPVTFC